MNAATSSRWRVRLQIALWRHGSAGRCLLASLLVAAGLLGWMLWQTDAALTQTQQALARERNSPPNTRTALQPDDEATQRLALQAVLQASPKPDEVVRQIAALSQSAGIAWAQGEYRSQWHADTQTTQWQVTQPVEATYLQLRQLIDAVLRAHPNVSLDHVALQREDTTQSQIKVRLRWSIWTANDKPPEPAGRH